MSDPKLKPYAITLRVKPKANFPLTYQSKTFKGISLAKNAADAKEQAIEQMISSIKSPIITKDECLIKECIPYCGFIFTSKPESEDGSHD